MTDYSKAIAELSPEKQELLELLLLEETGEVNSFLSHLRNSAYGSSISWSPIAFSTTFVRVCALRVDSMCRLFSAASMR